MVPNDVSVVIPAYNAESFITDALDSIFRQTFSPAEVIVVNDGSRDRTAQAIEQWIRQHQPAYPVRLINQANRGIAATRNEGIQRASGAWIAFLDADDVFEPGHLAALLQTVALHPGAIGAFASGRLMVDGKVVDARYDDYWDNPCVKYGRKLDGIDAYVIGKAVFPRLIKGNFIKPSSLMVSRTSANEVGLFNVDLGTAEDREFLVRLIMRGDFVYSPEPITRYRWHDDNASHVRNAHRNMENGLKALKVIAGNRSLGLGPVELTACAEAISAGTREYFYISSQNGPAVYWKSVWFVRDNFGCAVALRALSPKNIARSFLYMLVPGIKKQIKDYPDL